MLSVQHVVIHHAVEHVRARRTGNESNASRGVRTLKVREVVEGEEYLACEYLVAEEADGSIDPRRCVDFGLWMTSSPQRLGAPPLAVVPWICI